MIRRLVPVVAAIALGCTLTVRAQSSGAAPSYLAWTAADAQRIGKSMRVSGRVGGAFDLRVVHTERSFNYKLRATWLTKAVIQASARLQQLSERLSDAQTEALVHDATAAGDIVIMVEIDPREGSGVIPNDWSAFFGPAGDGQGTARGANTPALEKVKALHGVYARDYNYDVFWVVFSGTSDSGQPLLPAGVTETVLTVRIAGKEGRVSFPVAADTGVRR